MKKRVAIMISGRGSNMEALIAASHQPDYPAEIVLVISNDPEAYGLKIAEIYGVKTYAIDHRPFGKNRLGHETQIDAVLHDNRIDIVCLAGYMRLLTEFFIEPWAGRILNIHPSLLPEFPGLHTHKRVLAAGKTEHGCTVHLATKVMDDGPIIMQSRVPVYQNDTEETLAARVLEQEHIIYPASLVKLCLDKWCWV